MGDYTVESAIARMQDELEAAQLQASETLRRLDKLAEIAKEKTFTEGGKAVRATVDGSGALRNLVIEPVDRSSYPADRLAAEITSAILAAKSTSAHEVNKRVAKIVPGLVPGVAQGETP